MLEQLKAIAKELVDLENARNAKREELMTAIDDKSLNKIVIKDSANDNLNKEMLDFITSLNEIFAIVVGKDIIIAYESNIKQALTFVSHYKRPVLVFTNDWLTQLSQMQLYKLIENIKDIDDELINSNDVDAILEFLNC